MKSRTISISIIMVSLLIGSSFFVRMNDGPPEYTRIILENTYGTYIAPPCFEQAQATNNLAESTLSEAKKFNYRAESSCTENQLQPELKSVFVIVAEKMGLKVNKWDW